MLRLLVVCVAGFGLCLGQVLKPGKCPEFTSKTDFEVAPYLGKWVENARFATKDQEGQTCNFAEYSDKGDGTVAVHNAGLEADGTFTEIFGYVELTDVPGSLDLHLDGVPVVGAYDVLDTDYETYAAVYSCLNILGLGHSDQAWILGRHVLSEDELNLALSAFTRWGIEIDRFLYTPQDDCSALP